MVTPNQIGLLLLIERIHYKDQLKHLIYDSIYQVIRSEIYSNEFGQNKFYEFGRNSK